MSEKKSLADQLKEFYGMPWWMYLAFLAFAFVCMYTGVLGTDSVSFLFVCGALAIGLYKFGELLPIWNTYIGGGLLMVFFGTSVMQYFHLIPEEYVTMVDDIAQGDFNLLTAFIVFLIVGSILSLDRKILIRSFAGYIPSILGGVVGAILLNVLLLFIFKRFFFESDSQLSYITVIFLSLILSVISMFGDLAASTIKRNFGIKDFGKLLPGHGGIMDRFDSALFVMPVLYSVISLINNF